jgi:hypothetical protein
MQILAKEKRGTKNNVTLLHPATGPYKDNESFQNQIIP